MRRNISLLFILILIFIIASCYDDKGSYDYQDINEVGVGGLGEAISVIFKKDTIKITPELNFSMDNESTGRYEYEWKAVPELSNPNPGGIIGRSRNLEYFTELYPGNYFLYLKIKDKETGLLWMNYVPLTIRTQVARGFLVLGENKDGNVGLDMVAMAADTIVLKDLLKGNGLPLLKNPKRVMYTGAYTAWTDPYVRLWIMTESGSYYVNTTTFEGSELNTFRPMVYTTFDIPETLNPVHMIAKSNKGNMSTNRMVACDNGDVFLVSLYSGEYYSNPVNRTLKTQDKLYKAFPYIFSAVGYIYGYVLYDTDDNRFLRIGTSATYTTELTDKADDIFPWNQGTTGRKLIYGENSMNTDGGAARGASFALMKDPANKYYIYKFYAYSSATKLGGYSIDPAIATNIDQASMFAFASKRTLLLYVVGNTLYAYDYNIGHEKLFTKQFDDEITMLKFDIEADANYTDLYIGTYNATKGGMLQKYTLSSDQNVFELEPDEKCYWEDLVKIKDIEWRNSSK